MNKLDRGVTAPKPTRRNPFKPDSLLAKQFDSILHAYSIGHKDVIRENGTVRCMGNGWADAFWLGYDSVPPSRVPKATLAWACYGAGQAQRLTDNERNVYVPPKTNSVVQTRPPAQFKAPAGT